MTWFMVHTRRKENLIRYLISLKKKNIVKKFIDSKIRNTIEGL
jgi:hypothetical protein